MSALIALQAWNNGSQHIRRLAGQLGSTEKALAASKEIHHEVVAAMAPGIRSALAVQYAKSGLKTNSGALKNAVGTNARVEAASAYSGIFIAINNNASGNVFKRAAAFEYGAIYGGGEKKSEHKKSKKFSASIYASTGKKEFAGAHYVPPKASFFDLSGYDFQGIYVRLFNDRLQIKLKGK